MLAYVGSPLDIRFADVLVSDHVSGVLFILNGCQSISTALSFKCIEKKNRL